MKIRKLISLAIIQICLVISISLAAGPTGYWLTSACCGATCNIFVDGSYIIDGHCESECEWCRCDYKRADQTWVPGITHYCP